MDFVRGKCFSVKSAPPALLPKARQMGKFICAWADRRKGPEEIVSKFKKNKAIQFLTCIPYSNINIANSDI